MKIVLIESRGTSKFLHNGLAYLSGVLKQNDRHALKIFDLNFLDWSEDKMIEAIEEEKPDLIGFSVKSFSVNNVLNLARKIKEKTAAKMIAGGPHITLCAKEFFAIENNDIFDFGFQGEGDISFPIFCDNLVNKEKYKEIAGLVYKDDKGVWQFNKSEFVSDLNNIARPDFKNFAGGEIEFEKQEGYPLLTSRGCPYSCIYCSVSKISGRKWRARNVENILSELEEAIKVYNIKSFKIIDDNFTLDMERAKEFCRKLIGKNLNLKWNCPNGIRADKIDDELADLMRRAGCGRVSLGIESGDEKVFNFINKGEKLEAVEKAVKVLKKAGIKVDGFFIIGLPFETVKSAQKSARLAEKLGLNSVKWNMLVPYPQTVLWDWVMKNGKTLKSFTQGQHFSREKSIEPTFETADYKAKDRVRAYKIANLSTGAYQYVFKRPKNKGLFYLKYSFYLLRYNPALFFKKLFKKAKIIK